MTLSRSSSEYEALLKTVVGEAIGEGRQGQIAVAWVIKNRVNDSRWPNTIHGVCYQPHQFECMTNSNVDRLVHSSDGRAVDSWLPNVFVETSDPTGGANHYYAFKGPQGISAPDWTSRGRHTTDIGHHRFYKL